MKQQVFENADKTRRAVVGGTKVLFYVRRRRQHGYTAPKPVWHQNYSTAAVAREAAALWAAGGDILKEVSRTPAAERAGA